MLKRILTGTSLLLVLLCGLLLASWLAPLNNTETLRVDIRPGQTLGALSRQWEAEGWLPSALVLRIQARLLGYERSLRTGEYDIPPGLNGTQLLGLLATATPVSYRITLVEGQPLREALRLLRLLAKFFRVLSQESAALYPFSTSVLIASFVKLNVPN